MSGGGRWSLLVLLLVLAACQRQASTGQGGTSQVTRAFTTPNAYTGQPFDVRLTITMGPDTECGPDQTATCNDYYVLEETPPPNLAITSLNGPGCGLTTTQPPKIVCVVLANAQTTAATYTLTLPAAPQTLTFAGRYMVQGDRAINTVGGDNSVAVLQNPSCADWTCDAWTPWTNPTESCGTRTRQCTDTNHCAQPDTRTETGTAQCPVHLCGNGALDAGEACDGTLLNGKTCVTLNSTLYSGGTLACLPTCLAHDAAACTPIPNPTTQACTSSWNCGDWAACKNGHQRRDCTDTNACTTPTNTPETDLTCNEWITPQIIGPSALAIAGIAAVFVFILTRRRRRR